MINLRKLIMNMEAYTKLAIQIWHDQKNDNVEKVIDHR